MSGPRTGDGGMRIVAGNRSRHSRHQTRPSLSVLAALSSFFPHPGLPSSFRRPFASLPPHSRHVTCHLVPCGPGTTPLSIKDTALSQPGQAGEPPNRGNVKFVVVAGAEGGGRSYRLEEGVLLYVVVLLFFEVVKGATKGVGSLDVTLESGRTLIFSGGVH